MLKITINSFSFKKGIPADESGNGGGFVFDCRGLQNPGRLEKYMSQTGNDKDVIDYLNNDPNTKIFLEAISKVISVNIENYLERGFSHILINFGCTGGQHRSVYCCNQTASFIKNTYPQTAVLINHTELANK